MTEADRPELDLQAPVTAAAERVLRSRLRGVRGALRRIEAGAAVDREAAHDLRVATRQAAAALQAFSPWLVADRARRARRWLRRVRRTAAGARDADVHEQLLDEVAPLAPEDLLPAIDHLRERILRDRACAADGLLRLANRPRRKRKPRRLAARLVADGGGTALGAALGDALRPAVSAFRTAASRPLSSLENLHALRLAAKRAKYVLEIFLPCMEPGAASELSSRLGEVQRRLGAVSDIDQLIRRIEAEARALDAAANGAGGAALDELVRPGLHALLTRYIAVRGRRHAEVIEWLEDTGLERTAEDLGRLAEGPGRPDPSRPGACGSLSAGGVRVGLKEPCRVAAIDVGTNSIRLLVAEVHPDGTYRGVDDEREPARIGRGLVQTGLIADESMERAASAVARMAEIARGLGAVRTRVIGTAAMREARNGPRLVQLVRERAGLELEIIGAEEEGRLAFLSAAHAFDLGSVTAGVADVGGGSTQVVLSAGCVTDQIYTLPLGAVRLTEMFGGPEASAGDRFKEMRRHVKRTLRRAMGDRPFVPQAMIGTGGTFTTLANILTQRETGPGGPALPWRAAPGQEVLRSEARHLLDLLRKMPVADRARVHGLPPERADIFVAGLTIIECLLRRLGINAVRIHERGVRDGLVLTMGRDLFGTPAGLGARPDPVRSARRFAEVCRYERPHSEHVTRLALSLFDQLAAAPGLGGAWAAPEARRLLEAAGLLHDVGYLVNYAQHHKHSYHLIAHADLPGFTGREVGIIAQVARYHRKSAPRRSHEAYAALAREDRRLVLALAAILRVADGLDRTHTQSVAAVTLVPEDGGLLLRAEAEHEPATDLWGARRKSRLFERAFGRRLRWAWAPGAPAAREAAAAEPAALA